MKPSFMDIVAKASPRLFGSCASQVGPSKMMEVWPKYEEKMKKERIGHADSRTCTLDVQPTAFLIVFAWEEGLNDTAIAAFKYTYGYMAPAGRAYEPLRCLGLRC